MGYVYRRARPILHSSAMGRLGATGSNKSRRINLTATIEVTLANGVNVRVRRRSHQAGALLKLLIIEAVQNDGSCGVESIRGYLRQRGVDLPPRTVYYYLNQLVKIGALKHSYGAYSVTPHTGDVYRTLMRLVLNGKRRNDNDNCKEGVGGRRACARNNTIILKYYGSSGSTRRRKGIIVVPGFTVVEGTEVGVRLWYPALLDALREAIGDRVKVDRPRRLMKYVDGRLFFHYDISATREEQVRFMNGRWSDIYVAMALDVLTAIALFERVWGARELDKLLRLRRRVGILLSEPPTLDAWVGAEGGDGSGSAVVGPVRGK